MLTRRAIATILYILLATRKGLPNDDLDLDLNMRLSRLTDHRAVMLTWYGKVLHGNFMANGERFNMNDPHIAASPILPFGTKLEIWYGGRKLDVVIKDRMPEGTPTNQLDLSWAGAKSLGILRIGRVITLGKELE